MRSNDFTQSPQRSSDAKNYVCVTVIVSHALVSRKGATERKAMISRKARKEAATQRRVVCVTVIVSHALGSRKGATERKATISRKARKEAATQRTTYA